MLALLILFLLIEPISAQDDQIPERESDSVTNLMRNSTGMEVSAKVTKVETNPLAPSKAAFYSAILPGLGQVYNKRYWKVPIVYAALGTGIYAYTYNDNQYDRFRAAFKRRRAGFTDDEFYDLNNSGIVPGSPDFSDQALQDAQERFQRDRDLSLLITIALYVLNIIDANVDAHLKQFNVNEDLGLDMRPFLEFNPAMGAPEYGLALQIKF